MTPTLDVKAVYADSTMVIYGASGWTREGIPYCCFHFIELQVAGPLLYSCSMCPDDWFHTFVEP